MARYVKRPMEVDAVKWDGLNAEEVDGFVGGKSGPEGSSFVMGDEVQIQNPGGVLVVKKGEYIVRSVDGSFYVDQAADFEACFDRV